MSHYRVMIYVLADWCLSGNCGEEENGSTLSCFELYAVHCAATMTSLGEVVDCV